MSFIWRTYFQTVSKQRVSTTIIDFNQNWNVLYKILDQKYYQGGKQEYDRLEKAAGLDEDDGVHDAAYEAASYGSFPDYGFSLATQVSS